MKQSRVALGYIYLFSIVIYYIYSHVRPLELYMVYFCLMYLCYFIVMIIPSLLFMIKVIHVYLYFIRPELIYFPIFNTIPL